MRYDVIISISVFIVTLVLWAGHSLTIAFPLLRTSINAGFNSENILVRLVCYGGFFPSIDRVVDAVYDIVFNGGG